MTQVSVRYMVDDLDSSVAFYTEHLDFTVETPGNAGYAVLARGSLRLLLSTPGGRGGASRAMPDGRRPQPGGWNRVQIEVEEIDQMVKRLEDAGARFRNVVVSDGGGKQVLLEDPSGNIVELFEPTHD